MSGRTASRKPPSPERQGGLRAHGGAVVGEGGQQQPARAAVLELARQVHEQPARLRAAGRGEARAPSRAGRAAPSAAQRLRGRGLEAGIAQDLDEAAAPRAGRAISPSAATAARRTVGSSSPQRAPAARAWPWRCRSRPSAAAAAQRTLQCSSSRARSERGHRLRIADRAQALRGGAAQVAVGVRAARPTSGRTAAAARIAPSASTAAKRSSLRASPRKGSSRGTRLRVAHLAQGPQGHEPHLAVGVVEEGQEGAAVSGSSRLPSESTACCRTRLLVVEQRRAQEVGHPGRLDLAQRLDGGRAARSPAGRATAR